MKFAGRAALAAFALLLPVPALADALIDNVSGVALDGKGRTVRFTGILVSPEGKVTRLLEKGDKRPKKLDWRADMNGRIAIPGMVDAGGHFMELGFRTLALDLSGTRSLSEALTKIAQYAAQNPDRPWILGGGWNAAQWGGREPGAAELDIAVGDRPVWLISADGQTGWANSAAMKAAGVTAATKAPLGGTVGRTGAGAPNGVFTGTAQQLIAGMLPRAAPRDMNAAFLKAQEALLSRGVTAAADLGTSLDDWLTYRRMADLGLLRVRLMSYADGVDTALRVAGQGPTPWLYDDRLRMGGISLRLDGPLSSRGAWLKAPYADAPQSSGAPLLPDTQLLNLMSRGAMDEYQLAIRATGDRAVAQVLDAIAELGATYKGDRRWRIEGARVIDPADLPALQSAGVIAAMAPVAQLEDRALAEARLGAARVSGVAAWRALLGSGARLAFASEFPAGPPNPFALWAAGFTRTLSDGQPGWRVEAGVSRIEAWQALTSGGAYAGFGEQRFGLLQPGYRADFLIVDRDPLTAPADQLRMTQVLETWVGGEKVWERKQR